MAVDERGRSVSATRRGFSAGFRNHSRGASVNDTTTSGASSGIIARLRARSRSASLNRANGRGEQPHQQDDDIGPPESSELATPAQIENIIEQHQLALKCDMVAMMENHEKEINFWKNRALRLKKKISQDDRESLNVSSKQSIDDGGNQILMEKVSTLEREVANRDILIDSLCKTRETQEDSLRKMAENLETQEKATDERVQLLENQLERLVEMTTKVASAISTRVPSRDNDESNNGKEIYPAHEISVLEQLLARVLAEKDRLLFENQNLRSILRDTKSTSSSSVYGTLSPLGESFQVSGDVKGSTKDFNAVDVSSKSTEEQSECAFEYQLSCRICHNNHNHAKYSGIYNGYVTYSQRALKAILEENYSQVWKIIQEEEGSISSSVCPDECNRERFSNSEEFRSSSLARHIARHCKHLSNEGDVLRWCQVNVKVEVQQVIDYPGLPPSEKRKRKKSKKYKGRKKEAGH